MIYLDNAATTIKKPQCVIDAVVNAMQSVGNAGRGTHEASLGAARGVYEVREKVARFFNAEDAARIAFTANSTEALNIAINGLFSEGDHVISTVLEHNSVLRPLYRIEKEQGVTVSLAGCDECGRVKYEDIEKSISGKTKAIICTHASNLTGNVVDIERVSKIAHNHNLLLVIDASQTAGVFDIDVQKMGIDVLCFTGHKGLLGPQGTGGIYVRSGIDIRPLKVGGSGVQTYNRQHPVQMPTALEAGTLNAHGIMGLGAAIDYLSATGLQNIREKEQTLLKRFYEAVINIPGIKLYGDFSNFSRCAICSLNIGDYSSAEVSDELFVTYGIATRPGGHCAPLMHKAMGTSEQGMVRFSFSHFNTEEEIDFAVKALKELSA